MVATGSDLGMEVTAQVTEMDNPIGLMLGNSHEIVECIQCLNGNGPSDTMELVYAQADALGYDIRTVIQDGTALNEFKQMCIRQGVAKDDIDLIVNEPWEILPRCKNSVEIKATSSGWISQINALSIGEILCKLGAGRTGENADINHGVGAELIKTKGDYIEAGSPWIRFDTVEGIDGKMIDQVQDALVISQEEIPPSSRILQKITM